MINRLRVLTPVDYYQILGCSSSDKLEIGDLVVYDGSRNRVKKAPDGARVIGVVVFRDGWGESVYDVVAPGSRVAFETDKFDPSVSYTQNQLLKVQSGKLVPIASGEEAIACAMVITPPSGGKMVVQLI